MINKRNDKYYIDNTAIEVIPMRVVRGKEVFSYEEKPSFFRIDFLGFEDYQFKSIAEAKKFLKQDDTIQYLLDVTWASEEVLMHKYESVQNNKKLLSRVKLNEEYKQLLNGLDAKKKEKITKWTNGGIKW